MAIYRADKAVMSFGTEAAQGGTPEGATAVSNGSGTAAVNMASGLPAGSQNITVDALSGITAGEFIQIGGSATQEKEIRRVEHVEGTTKLHLDTPTAFFHPDDTVVTVRDRTYLSANTKKGDYWITVNSATNLAAGDVIAIDHEDTPVSTHLCELRRIVEVSSTSIRLNYPLHFDHTSDGSGTTQIQEVNESAAGLYYQHDVWERTELDTVSWNVLLRDSGDTTANDIIRRYYGGKIGGASIAASEEGMLTMSWDTVPFLGMNHNQADHSAASDDAYSTTSQDMPGFGLLQTIDDGDIGDTSTNNLKDRAYPSTNPYFFSDGTLSLFGTSFARVSDFNISIDNAVESRYYINTRHGKLNRGPNEHREGARAYNMSATLALPDSTDSSANSRTLFKELLLEGDYGTNTVPNHSGFDITLSFSRGTNDSIVFTIPSDGTSAKGGNEQGAFITSATHNIGGSGILSVDANMFFRNMKIQIKDSALLYP
jgi:hypothetical protein